ncbi:hypothetical protein BH23PAT2_BH23PAT2_03980 [soil metagenome]
MLAIRMQRIGRKGYAQYRVVVQDSRLTPTSGRVVATIGHYNPHTKVTTLEKDEAQQYLKNGAQPSERVTRLLLAEGVKLPIWVEVPDNKAKRSTKNPAKLRKNQPAEAEAPEEKEPAVEVEPATEETPTSEEPVTEEAETKDA